MFNKIKSFVEINLAIWFIRFGLFLIEKDIEKFESRDLTGLVITNVYKNDQAEFLSDLMVFQNFLSHVVFKNRNYINKKMERNIENIFKRIDDDINHCHII